MPAKTSQTGTGGFTAGRFHSDLHWRWTKTPEERLLSKSGNEPGALPAVQAPAQTPEKRLAANAGNAPEELPPVRATAKTPEKRPVAKAGEAPEPARPEAPDTVADWSGFRGPHRDDTIPGVRIKTDWTASPPVALWRRPIELSRGGGVPDVGQRDHRGERVDQLDQGMPGGRMGGKMTGQALLERRVRSERTLLHHPRVQDAPHGVDRALRCQW